MSKPVHSKNEILRSNTGLTINPSKAYSRSETRDKLTGLTIFQGGLFRQSQAIKNRFPSRATGTPRLEEHMLIVFCMLLVPSVQVKHQGSDQSPQLSVSIPSKSSFKVQVKVNGFRSRSTVFSIHSVQVKLLGSRQGPRFSDQGPRFQEKHQCSDLPAMVIVSAIQVKCQGPDFPAMGIAINVRRQGCDLPAKCSLIQVNQQDSDLPSMVIVIDVRRQGCDLPAKCSLIQVNQQDSDLPSMVIAIDVRRQGSDLPAMVLVIQVNQQDSDLPSMVIAIHVKRPGSDLPTMFTAIRVKRQGPDRLSMVIAIRVKHQEPDPPSMVIVINVKRQGPDRPLMVIVIQDKHHGFDLPAMFKSPAIQDKHQGSDLPAMAIVIQVKHLGSDRQSMVKGIKQHYGCILTSFNLVLVSSHPGQASRFYSPVHGVFQIKHQGSDLPAIVIDLIYLQSPAIQIKHQDSDLPAMVIVFQIKHQDSDLPAMVIDLIYLQSPAIQVKHQDSHLPAMGIVLNPPRSCFTDPDSVRGYRPNSKDQNSNLGYSSNIKDLISNQGYGYTLFSLSLHAFFRIGLVCLRSGYTMKNFFSFQCDRYIHLVRPLVTVGFISLLASQSKPAIMDPISVQCYSVLAVKVKFNTQGSGFHQVLQAKELGLDIHPDLQIYIFRWAVDYWLFLSVYCFYCQGQPSRIRSPSSMTVFSPPRWKNKDFFFIHGYSQGQSIQVYCSLGQTELPKFYYLPSARAEANDQSFDILLGSQQAFNAQLYIKGRRYTRIFKQFTKN
ncbi:hypothetical protein PHYBLDRAFT_189629 [Phycomyces blakesleeanus NRRL 1555(-)]|uniref:Uncharacterized protein n=1 Tax=Phycomyces blakesleeanus (strain ATCC 8743b / DSM 1359 / FGSC 10004 / NBRC 33097 / NRRL 1555) TaxID=763407 RepID=A0A162Z927_PHYB8|nr:hypothetical protein PHYBLDRAFT_189629 [Phycomyces blakesleeanus NRRL 1555(-)]OAD65141.1 hypothetical protein PHYBLDRAFT_189629 [Phycomyces blakesleeanus NRRL 1555(-)]|eukprot:XP_018283181.1 hypothetical protein PHYBLDRAFT_189629 [Phycomyces blakesleeanus NRRL 1555(-)]